MSEINTEELRRDFNKYKNIPEELFDYLAHAIKNNISDKYTEAVIGENRLGVFARIDDMFAKAAIACKLTPKEIVKGLDFNPKDCGRGRIEAFLAELRRGGP